MGEKKEIVIKCAKCKNDFTYLWGGRGKKAKFCENCLKERHKAQLRKCNKKRKQNKMMNVEKMHKKEWVKTALNLLYSSKLISGWRYRRILKKIERVF